MIRCRIALVAFFLYCAVANSQSLALANAAARQGRADEAIAQGRQVVASDPRSVEGHLLLCRLHGSLDQFDAAIHECESARDLRPADSGIVLALARAFGARADHAGPLTGMRMVGRIRENFERAVQLDPSSSEALSDLGQFYVEAPGMVGGGLDKARSLLPKLQAVSPARAHRLAAMIAVKSGDNAGAESEFAQELALEHSPEAYVDLANYYRRRRMWSQSAQNAVLAIQKDAKHGPDTIDAAKILIEEDREQSVAQKGLRDYLRSTQAADVMPAAAVHTLLGQSLKATGSFSAAQQEFAAALSLARDYAPARRAVAR